MKNKYRYITFSGVLGAIAVAIMAREFRDLREEEEEEECGEFRIHLKVYEFVFMPKYWHFRFKTCVKVMSIF